jgi:hypothetical protein
MAAAEDEEAGVMEIRSRKNWRGHNCASAPTEGQRKPARREWTTYILAVSRSPQP